jgi:acetyl esterase/lipase
MAEYVVYRVSWRIGTLPQDKLGLGEPSEDALFLNIVCPPSQSSGRVFPVKVFIHGGFLQFGSPHSLSSQAQYVSSEREEIWVNIGYRYIFPSITILLLFNNCRKTIRVWFLGE